MPGIPATPRKAWGGSPMVSIFCSPAAGALKTSRQPNMDWTRSPGFRAASADTTTSPMAPPSRGAPIWKGGT